MLPFQPKTNGVGICHGDAMPCRDVASDTRLKDAAKARRKVRSEPCLASGFRSLYSSDYSFGLITEALTSLSVAKLKKYCSENVRRERVEPSK